MIEGIGNNAVKAVEEFLADGGKKRIVISVAGHGLMYDIKRPESAYGNYRIMVSLPYKKLCDMFADRVVMDESGHLCGFRHGAQVMIVDMSGRDVGIVSVRCE